MEARNALSRLVRFEPGEGAGLFWSAISFFFILGGYYVIRPLRDEMGASAGGGFALNWLFFGTLAGTLVVNPLFGALVARTPRRVFVPAVMHAFAASFVVFFGLLTCLHGAPRLYAGRFFFVYASVFNLLVVSVFWGFLADLFRSEQAKRLFGFIGLGGTVGGIAGGLVTIALARRVGPVPLLLVAAGLFEAGVLCLHRLARVYRVDAGARERASLTGDGAFIPVDYHDTRLQLVENMTFLSGAHTIKGGVEFNRTNAAQTFRGFGNGRIIFGSVDGFLNFTKNSKYVECSNGTSNNTGNCPAGTSITGPVALYLQHVPGTGLTIDQAGTQDIVQYMYSVYLQDKWQPAPNLTVQIGLRWDAQIQPDPITPADQVFYSQFIGKTSKGQAFPSDGNIPSDKAMWQPRLGITWDPKNDGKTVVRANGGIYYGLIPGLNLASSRSTNGTLGYDVYRDSSLTNILGPVPAYPNIIPLSSLDPVPFGPGVYVFDKNFQNPRTYSASVGVERELTTDFAVSLKYNYAHTIHISRFVNRNDALLGSPWSTGLDAGGANGVGTLTTVESTAKSLYNGITLGLEKRYSNNFAFQAYYTLSWDKSDDDNERDPFTLQYAKITDLDAEYGYSNRDQRHRFNAIVLYKAPFDINVNARYSYRSAQPKSLTATGADAGSASDPNRINADGSVTERNTGRKDNQFSSLDLRVSRPFQIGNIVVEPIAEVFNLFNSKNLKKPGNTSLLFNFDGTVQSGLGDPLQAQFGVRVVF